ncbi:hypothetical protein INT47_007543 [Mucor saturninus]|uniref:Kelch repeat protein n=1 Tax=Mucor saturninus TaxID=64648 RepID=A0A8H7V1Q8_9FUNG|nr:hypothetical protein INT47_007543 [Mucor saturninus]
MLDIFNSSKSTADQLKDRWETITTNTAGIDLKARDAPQTVQLPDGKTMLMSGGWSSRTSKLSAQTIAFNAENRSWVSYPDYTEAPYGVRQIYHAPSAYVPEYGIAFYGGLESHFNSTYTLPGINVTAYDDIEDNHRQIGYTNLTFLDIRKPSNPWSFYPTQANLPAVFGRYQTSIYDAKSNRIFYFGGRYSIPPSTNNVYYTFANSVTFDLTKGEWGTQEFTGTGPTSRIGHSTTLIGPNKRDVLVYGGEAPSNNGKPLLDYCFTVNLDTNQWTQQIIEAPNNLILMRTQHSAVPVNNDTVFIVFGKDPTDSPTISLVMLNVTNPSKITWLEAYADPNAPVITSPNSNSTSPRESDVPEKKASLSTGAIAGISVGAAVIAIGIASIFFCLSRKRKTENQKLKTEELERQNKDERTEEPVMEVNWDEIDKKYVEVPTGPPVGRYSYSPQLTNDFSTTDNDNDLEAYKHIPAVGKSIVGMQTPDTFDNDLSTRSNITQSLQKPDGGL